MKITYKPGGNPADARTITLYAGNERIENCRVVQAYNKQGSLTLKVEIRDCEINREPEGLIHSDIQGQPEPAKKRADSGEDQLSDSRDAGDLKKRDQLRADKRTHRDKSKD
jgi:hypothetical protein